MRLGQEVTALKGADSARAADGAAPVISGITVEKSVEFSYEELASATGDFSLANKIGEGGFGAVYYAELRGEVCGYYRLDFNNLELSSVLLFLDILFEKKYIFAESSY